MPPSETPANPKRSTPGETGSRPASSGVAVAEETSPAEAGSVETGASDPTPSGRGYSTSRFVDYETHELLEKISEYEDERRWQRIREGIWLSIIAHILFFSALTWIPKYVFHAPEVIDPFDAIKQRKDLTYLDQLPDAIKQVQKIKPPPPPLKPKDTTFDRKVLDALKTQEAQRKTAPPQPKAQNEPPPQPVPQQVEPPPTPAPAVAAPPQPTPQLPVETPRPAPVPARPNFNLGSQNPADQLRQALRESGRSGAQAPVTIPVPLPHDSNAAGGVQILSDTQGVNFEPYIQRLIRETYRTWDPLIPDEVNPPINKRGETDIVFTILPNGRIQAGGMILVGRSGDVALDRAAWGALTGADFPPLPREFHGPYLQLRFDFHY